MEYTNRVQLCEDGIYRWYYDLDMRKNRYMLNTTLKILGIIGAGMLLMVVFLSPGGGMSRWTAAGIIFGVFAVVVMITLGIYMVMILRRDGFYRYRYEMGPEGVMLRWEEGDIRRTQTLGTVTAVAGAVAGKPVQGTASSMALRSASDLGYTAFKSVRKAVVDREKECIFLKFLIGENCVYVCQEDFDLVKDYILSRLKENTIVS